MYTFYFGLGILELKGASNLTEQPEALRHQLEKGWSSVHPQLSAVKTVETARDFTLEAIRQRGNLAPNTPLAQGIAAEPYKNFSFFRQTDVAYASEILQVADSTQTFDFYQRLPGGTDVITFDKRWLSAWPRVTTTTSTTIRSTWDEERPTGIPHVVCIHRN